MGGDDLDDLAVDVEEVSVEVVPCCVFCVLARAQVSCNISARLTPVATCILQDEDAEDGFEDEEQEEGTEPQGGKRKREDDEEKKQKKKAKLKALKVSAAPGLLRA